MGWESRGNGRYYYRKRREGRRVVSEYVSDRVAPLIEMMDVEERSERERLRQTARIQREQFRVASQAVDEVSRWVRLMTEQTLIENGFHRHKGQWRKQRHE